MSKSNSNQNQFASLDNEHLLDQRAPQGTETISNAANKHDDQPGVGAGDGGVAPDPFADLNALRLSQDFTALAGVKPVYTAIACRKPNRHEFVRVRPGDEWRLETACFTDREARETYLVAPALWSSLAGEVVPTVLLLTISRNSPVPLLWPVPLPGPDGRSNRWHESALEAARLAETRWLRVVADMTAGCYVPHVAAAELDVPIWPADLLMPDFVRLAFKDRFIASPEHPALKRLRGEI